MVRETNPASAHSAQALWGREANEHVRYGKGFHWVESPLVMAYVNEQITGIPKLDWLSYSYQKYLLGRMEPVTRVLSLGCGGGTLERQLYHLGFKGQIDACDFSEGAVEHARAMAAAEKIDNIHYFTSDLNQADLPREAYDVIFSGSALHHIANLEHLLDQVHLGLREYGLLIINEYVGPFQLQWTHQQTRIIDELLRLLPQEYRKHVSAPGQFKDTFLGPASIRDLDAIDPTESIRSDEIVHLIRARFSIKEQKNFGGTLLHMLLQDIVGNFDPNDPIDTGFLNLLIYVEKLLIRENELESDFAFLVAEKTAMLCAEGHTKEYAMDLASELKARDVRIQSMDERFRQSERYVRDLETRLRELSDSPSLALRGDGSAAWQMMLKFRQWKECRLPTGSRRRKVYDALLARLRRRLARDHESS